MGSNFGVPVCPDDQHMGEASVRGDGPDEVQACRVGPLDVVQEQDERVRPVGEDLHEVLKDKMKAVLGFLGPDLGDVGLPAYDELDLGDDVRDDLPVRAQGGIKLFSPFLYTLLALGQELAGQAMEGLNDGAVGHGPAQLIVFAGDEISPLPHDGIADLAHQGGFADARLAGNQQDLHVPVAHPLEGLEQDLKLMLPSHQDLGDVELQREVVPGKLEGLDAACFLKLVKTVLEVGHEPVAVLVALVGCLGQKFHDNAGYRCGHLGINLVRGHGCLGDVGVDELKGVAGREGRAAREHLVESDAQGVKVGAVIHGAVHAAGLLGRQVGQRLFDDLGVVHLVVPAGDLGGDAEIGEFEGFFFCMVQDVGGFEVSMGDVPVVDVSQYLCSAHGQIKETLERDAVFHELAQGCGGKILHHEGNHVFRFDDVDDVNDTVDLDGAYQLIFMLEPGDVRGRGLLRLQYPDDHLLAEHVLACLVGHRVQGFPGLLVNGIPLKHVHGGLSFWLNIVVSMQSDIFRRKLMMELDLLPEINQREGRRPFSPVAVSVMEIVLGPHSDKEKWVMIVP